MKQSIHINCSPAVVFEHYRNTALWPQWDPELHSVQINEGLVEGAKGWLKPVSGPKARVEIVSVVEGQSFCVESKLPLCTMHFDHVLAASGDATDATHSVSFTGPAAFLFKRLIGASLIKGLPKTMLGLKQYSEKQNHG